MADGISDHCFYKVSVIIPSKRPLSWHPKPDFKWTVCLNHSASWWCNYNCSKHSLFTDPFICWAALSPGAHLIWWLRCLRNYVFSGVLEKKIVAFLGSVTVILLNECMLTQWQCCETDLCKFTPNFHNFVRLDDKVIKNYVSHLFLQCVKSLSFSDFCSYLTLQILRVFFFSSVEAIINLVHSEKKHW